MPSMAAMAVVVAVALPLASPAGATTPPRPANCSSRAQAAHPVADDSHSHDQRPDECRGRSPATGSPFTAGQTLNIFECPDADGLTNDLPTDGTACDGLTVNVGANIVTGVGGTVDATNYEIYQLPSSALFESANGSPRAMPRVPACSTSGRTSRTSMHPMSSRSRSTSVPTSALPPPRAQPP